MILLFRSKAYPCFGVTSGMDSRTWWFEVVKQTYKTTQDLNQIEPHEWDLLLPDVFNSLFNEVFGTSEGWRLKENAEYTLRKLKEWRDLGAGPKLGVVSNMDNRLPYILEGNV